MSELSENVSYSSDLITLRDLIAKIKVEFDYLKTKWIIIVLIGFIAGVYGYFDAYFEKPIYTATFTYALEDEKSSGQMGGALGLASSFGIEIGNNAGGAFGGSNLMELMHSRSLIEKTLLSVVTVNEKKKSLADFFLEIENSGKSKNSPGFNSLIFNTHNGDRSSFTRTQDSILGNIYYAIDKNQLNISIKDKKLSIGTIEVKSSNEMFAKLFCETLVKVVSDFYINSKSKKAKINVEILERQSDSIRSELNHAIAGVAKANDITYNLNPALNIKKTPSLTRQIDVQANTAILTQLVTNLEMAKVALRKDTPLFQEIDKPILPLQVTKASKLKSLLLYGITAGVLTIVSLLFFSFIKKRNQP